MKGGKGAFVIGVEVDDDDFEEDPEESGGGEEEEEAMVLCGAMETGGGR